MSGPRPRTRAQGGLAPGVAVPVAAELQALRPLGRQHRTPPQFGSPGILTESLQRTPTFSHGAAKTKEQFDDQTKDAAVNESHMAATSTAAGRPRLSLLHAVPCERRWRRPRRDPSGRRLPDEPRSQHRAGAPPAVVGAHRAALCRLAEALAVHQVPCYSAQIPIQSQHGGAAQKDGLVQPHLGSAGRERGAQHLVSEPHKLRVPGERVQLCARILASLAAPRGQGTIG